MQIVIPHSNVNKVAITAQDWKALQQTWDEIKASIDEHIILIEIILECIYWITI